MQSIDNHSFAIDKIKRRFVRIKRRFIEINRRLFSTKRRFIFSTLLHIICKRNDVVQIRLYQTFKRLCRNISFYITKRNHDSKSDFQVVYILRYATYPASCKSVNRLLKMLSNILSFAFSATLRKSLKVLRKTLLSKEKLFLPLRSESKIRLSSI